MVCIQGFKSTGMEADRIRIKALLVSFAMVILVEGAAMIIVAKGCSDIMIILGCARLIEIIVIITVIIIWEKGLPSIGLAPSMMADGFRKGLIWSTGFGIVALFSFAILFLFGINPAPLIYTNMPAVHSKIVIFFLVGGILAPAAEEIFFRGIIYGFFRKWGVCPAFVSSVLIFVIAHHIIAGFPVTQVAGGIIFAVAYEIEGNLMVPITIHSLGNMVMFIISLLR